jgi:hypothetical protein
MPDPCATCGATSPRPVCQSTCRTFLPYAAKRELLEALKAGGVKVRDIRHYLQYENSHFTNTRRGPGHLIFIPEAQG